MPRLWTLVIAGSLIWTQAPVQAQLLPTQPPPVRPLLEYKGKPLAIAGACKTEQVTNLGLPCSEDEPCAIFVELSDVKAVGTRVLLAGNLHTSSATLESLLLVSEDGGATWSEPLDRIPYGTLEGIQFVDFEHGWISGHSLVNIPRDPFFLLSNDGGKTWRRRPVFGEARVGTIEKFYFDAKNHGWMTLDRSQSGEGTLRYEMYETQTGGDGWMLRQASPKPIELKQQTPLPAEWRLRPDAASKSYRVERQGAQNRWQMVASFLVAAGECKPADESRPLEPPPEPTTNAAPQAPAASGDFQIPGPADKQRKQPSLKRPPKNQP